MGERHGHTSIPLRRRIRRALARPALPALACLLGLALMLPSLGGGFALDDHLMLRTLAGLTTAPSPSQGPSDLFTFASGDPDDFLAMREVGTLPWWAPSSLRLRFWRPLAAWSHRVDHRLWSGVAGPMHAHSLGWMALLMIGAAALFRTLSPAPSLAGLACLLFALDDSHGPAVGWISNRNAIISCTWTTLCLWAHVRWRRGGWRPGPYIACVALTLSLLAAEGGIAACAFLGAYVLVYERPLGTGLRSLIPYALVVLAWRAAYVLLGYGSHSSGAYIDPGGAPLRFVEALPLRALALLRGALGVFPADYENFMATARAINLQGSTVVSLVITAALALGVARWSRPARFWGISLLLACLPAAAAVPSNRNLVFMSVAGAGLLAALLSAPLLRPQWFERLGRWRWPAGAGLGILALFHIGVSPILLPLSTTWAELMHTQLRVAGQGVQDRNPGEGDVFYFLNPPSDLAVSYLPVIRAVEGRTAVRVRSLSAGMEGAVAVERPSRDALCVRPSHGYFPRPYDSMFGGVTHPPPTGEVIGLGDVDITPMSLTDDGRPERVCFHFKEGLEPLADHILVWEVDRYSALVLPPVGATVHLPAEPPTHLDAVKHALSTVWAARRSEWSPPDVAPVALSPSAWGSHPPPVGAGRSVNIQPHPEED